MAGVWQLMAIFTRATKAYWFVLSLGALFVITFFSLTPLPALPPVPGSDKTHHFLAYAVLMFPVALAKPKHWLAIALLFALWSGAIELIQPYVNRYGEWLDFAANTAGLTMGMLAARLFDGLQLTVGDNSRD
jgi:VanZ family protein